MMRNMNITHLYFLLNEIQKELRKYDGLNVEEYKMILEEKASFASLKLKRSKLALGEISKEQLCELLLLFKVYEQNQVKESIELVATAPPTIDSDLRKTIGVVRQIIIEAQEEILITSYSISEYFDEILDLMISKSLVGVKVVFLIDDNPRVLNYVEYIRRKSDLSNFILYKYNKGSSSLHAKVIVVDRKKAFVSSSNLSYNGIVNNLEIGTLITGKKIVGIVDLFQELINQKYFIKMT
ncbi:phospholipase D-like domain-containing protein [Bacillus cereus]|nr:phospholipase D-like domain-containing protein [Bacillus cereus]HDR8069095.1 hypothetical protein [Bacillus cereus]